MRLKVTVLMFLLSDWILSVLQKISVRANVKLTTYKPIQFILRHLKMNDFIQEKHKSGKFLCTTILIVFITGIKVF
jgi:hypothetical protein